VRLTTHSMQNAVWSALRRSRTESITEMFALPVGSRYWALVQQDGKYLWERPFISPRKSNPWRLTDVYISREDDNRDTRKQMPELAGPAPQDVRVRTVRVRVVMVTGPPDRRVTLSAALGFLALEPRARELQPLHRCFDNWRGIGDVVVGMERQGYRLHLTNTEPRTWRATVAHDAMTAAEGFAAAPTPWAAVQIAARLALA